MCSVIADILSGPFDNPVRVGAFNTVGGWARDASEDIARAVIDKAMSEHGPLSSITREFYERHTGEDVPRELVDW